MGYALQSPKKKNLINNCDFIVYHEVAIFDTHGIELAIKGAATVELAMSNEECTQVDIDECQICYDYTAPTDESPNPHNQWYKVGDIEKELKNSKNEALWDEICEKVIDCAMRNYPNEEYED